jgi:transposase-like protein
MEKGGCQVSRKRYKTEEIIRRLREAEVLTGQGMEIAEVCRRIGVTRNTYYRWRKEYGGLRIDQARRMKDLERENARLKKVVADLTLDVDILREAASGN